MTLITNYVLFRKNFIVKINKLDDSHKCKETFSPFQTASLVDLPSNGANNGLIPSYDFVVLLTSVHMPFLSKSIMYCSL